MLHRVGLKNFKLHKETTIDAKPITIFIGPNNSGKSSIFQALMLMKQARDMLNETQHGLQLIPTHAQQKELYKIDVGNFADIIRRDTKKLSISINGTMPAGELQKIVGSDTINIEYTVIYQNNEIIGHNGKIYAGQVLIKWNHSSKTGSTELLFESPKFPDNQATIRTFPSVYQPINVTSWSSSNSTENTQKFQNYISNLTSTIKPFLDSFHYIYALRGMEERAVALGGVSYNALEFVKLQERTPALTTTLAYNSSMKDELSGWFQQLFNVDFRVEMIPNNRVSLEIKAHDSVNPIINEGMGSNQIPFILIPIALAESGDSIFIEEPEAHLHPKAQTELIALLLKIFEVERKQYFIATHSEHILYGFLTAVAKGHLARDDITIYSFNNIGGKVEATQIEVEDDGSTRGGLPGFFEHNINELLDYLGTLKPEE